MPKVEMRLPQQDVEAEIKAFDANGKPVQVSKIVIEPIFHQANARVPLSFLTVVVDGEKGSEKGPESLEVGRHVLQLAGANGSLVLVDRSKKVTPQFETKIKKEDKKPKEGVKDVEPPDPQRPPDELIVSPSDPDVIDLPQRQPKK